MNSALFDLGLYLVYTISVFVIAQKSGHEYAWLAFIPVANLWLLCDMADVGCLWALLMLVPGLNILFYAFLWMRIAENTNKPPWLGIVMVVPLLNVAVACYMAFAEGSQFSA